MTLEELRRRFSMIAGTPTRHFIIWNARCAHFLAT